MKCVTLIYRLLKALVVYGNIEVKYDPMEKIRIGLPIEATEMGKSGDGYHKLFILRRATTAKVFWPDYEYLPRNPSDAT